MSSHLSTLSFGQHPQTDQFTRPEVMGVPNPVTNKLELHNTWLVWTVRCYIAVEASADPLKADVLKNYIGWAIKQGFGVIDVNIPKHLTGIDVSVTTLKTSSSNSASTLKDQKATSL